MKALVEQGGRVAQVVEDARAFPVSPGLSWIDCPDDTAPDHTWDGARFVAPSRDIDLPTAIKAEARRRILAAYPDWKQSNMTARAVELTRARWFGAPTPAEEAEEAALQAAWDWIKAVRSFSNDLEAQVAAMSPADRLLFAPALADWPAPPQ